MAEKAPTAAELARRIDKLESAGALKELAERMAAVEYAVATAHAALEQLTNAMEFLLQKQSHPKSPGISLNIEDKKNPDAGMGDIE